MTPARPRQRPDLPSTAGLLQRLWYLDAATKWHPLRFEWYFTRTREGMSIRRDEQAAVQAAMGAALLPSTRVLEIGSGPGFYTMQLAATAASVVAVDASPAMSRHLLRRLARGGVRNVMVGLGRLPDELPVRQSFDLVLSVGVLNYVEDLAGSLSAIADRLAPGGLAVLTVPPDTPAGRKYQRDELRSRKKIYVRSDAEVHRAARAAGLRIEFMQTAAEVTRVFSAVPASTAPAAGTTTPQ